MNEETEPAFDAQDTFGDEMHIAQYDAATASGFISAKDFYVALSSERSGKIRSLDFVLSRADAVKLRDYLSAKLL